MDQPVGPEWPSMDFNQVFPELELIRDVELRKKVVLVWEALWSKTSWPDIESIPTWPDIPAPSVLHTRCVVEIAVSVAASFERWFQKKVDLDCLVAAALLQDASKMLESMPDADGTVSFTEIGKQYPHAFWAAFVALQHDIPADVIHIILTHSPRASSFPNSVEGKILYYADQVALVGIDADHWRKSVIVTK